MSERFSPLDDRGLLKLLEVGVPLHVAAKRSGWSVGTIAVRLKTYLECKILRLPNDGGGYVDWKAFDQWIESRNIPDSENLGSPGVK